MLVLVTLVAGAGSARAAQKVVAGPGESIQAAVDAARPGDTIVVTGRHRENVAVTTDGITLRGAGAVLEPAGDAHAERLLRSEHADRRGRHLHPW